MYYVTILRWTEPKSEFNQPLSACQVDTQQHVQITEPKLTNQLSWGINFIMCSWFFPQIWLAIKSDADQATIS